VRALLGRLPSPATCIALVALFVALGGTTWAVTVLPRNSVGTSQLRDRAVTEHELGNAAVITRKLANGAVTAPKIKPGAVTGDRLAGDTLTGLQIDESTLGSVPLAADAERAKVAERAATADTVGRAAQADRADRAERADRADVADSATHADRAAVADEATHAADADTAEALEAVDYNTEQADIPEGGGIIATVDCDPGLVPVGGGYVQQGDFGDAPMLSSSGPQPGNNRWFLIIYDIGANTAQPITGLAYAICIRAGKT